MTKALLKPISHIIGESNYSVFHYTDGTKKMYAVTLGKLESEGIRIHKSVIINPEHIRQILNYGIGYRVQMNDGSVYPVAKRRVKEFLYTLRKG